jgi:hypothetical protein
VWAEGLRYRLGNGWVLSGTTAGEGKEKAAGPQVPVRGTCNLCVGAGRPLRDQLKASSLYPKPLNLVTGGVPVTLRDPTGPPSTHASLPGLGKQNRDRHDLPVFPQSHCKRHANQRPIDVTTFLSAG